MKTLFTCGLLFITAVAWADDSGATNAAPAAANAPADSAEKTAAMQIGAEIQGIEKNENSTEAEWSAVDAKVDGYLKQFGVTPKTTHNLVMLRKQELNLVRHKSGDALYNAFVQKLNADPLPEVREIVASIVALESKPMELQFTAVDGTSVDLAKLRGKVVLIDFWATWCPPCRDEVPNVVAAYKKYHDQGFEIVGVSLDQDKDALTSFTSQNGMTWPQYFDGQGWKNAISTRFGIHLIPSMWLIDKKGMLATIFGRVDLDGRVGKLLAAP